MATPKPWEQEWKVVEESDDEVETVDGAYVIAKTYGATEARADRAVFIAAAPAMARALRAFLSEGGHTPECGNLGGTDSGCSQDCRDGRAALKRAGVLP
jgi:NAD(P)H-flavin reductase